MRFPKSPPNALDLIPDLLGRHGAALWGASLALQDGRYLHWDQVRFREPPVGFSREEWWASIKFARMKAERIIRAMTDCYATRFTYADLDAIQRELHAFDRENVGEQILSALGNPDAKVEYRVRQLIEEAISSSEIEGARPTTREAAQQMLREKRPPASRDERMILNNLRAMERLQDLHASGERLTAPRLLELHRILGEDALEVEGAAGRFRTSEHDVTVSDMEGNVWHTPPSAHGLESRIEALLAFAHGDGSQDAEFIHPIIRAIIVHFWVGYEHPFRDGNGRMARVLYYWCLLKHGYEVAEFLSISGPIDGRPKDYLLAFAYTETDAGDLTYFILHQLQVMRTALDELMQHLRDRALRLRRLGERLANFDALNHRQRALLEHTIRHPTQGATIEGHATSHGVHYLTARADLADLETRGLLESRRVRRVKRYYASESLLIDTAERG